MAPRSSATTFRPASVSSLERMPPVQPRPTTTTSTSLSFVAIAPSPSAHVRDADGIALEFLVAEFLDIFAMHRDDAGEADHAPARLVAVAAVDRVGKHAFHHGLVDGAPEHARRQTVVEGDLRGGEAEQNLLALLLVHPVERLAVGLRAVRVGRRDAGAIELRGREGKLIALVSRALLPRPLHVDPLALAPGAGDPPAALDPQPHTRPFPRQPLHRPP